MGQTDHDKIGHKLKGAGFNQSDKAVYKGSNTNNDLIEY